MRLGFALAAATAATLLTAGSARAAGTTPRWVDRLLTLPGPVAGTIDLGGGFAHADEGVGPRCGYCSFNGTGVSVDGVLGIAGRVDIGFRVGFRGFDDGLGINEGAVSHADAYARPFDPLAFYPGVYGGDAFANPELRVRGRILFVKNVFELGVEGRAIFPTAGGTDFTQVVGVPMAFHIGTKVRIDLGAYSHFTFHRRVLATFEVPVAFWFQVTDRVWLGPMTGFRYYSEDAYADSPRRFDVNLGFGVGVSLARFLDLKAQIDFPRIDDGAHYVGAGAAVEFYFR